jgi:hypothetical protein
MIQRRRAVPQVTGNNKFQFAPDAQVATKLDSSAAQKRVPEFIDLPDSAGVQTAACTAGDRKRTTLLGGSQCRPGMPLVVQTRDYFSRPVLAKALSIGPVRY